MFAAGFKFGVGLFLGMVSAFGAMMMFKNVATAIGLFPLPF
jgi:hypothetical protein